MSLNSKFFDAMVHHLNGCSTLLNSISFVDSTIPEESIELLGRLLRLSPSITTCTLQACNLSGKNFSHLERIKFSNLKVLDISKNDLRNEEASRAVWSLLQSSRFIEELILSRTSLMSLKLDSFPLDTLKTVDLSGSNLKQSFDGIKELVSRSPRLSSLILIDCIYPSWECGAEILSSLSTNDRNKSLSLWLGCSSRYENSIVVSSLSGIMASVTNLKLLSLKGLAIDSPSTLKSFLESIPPCLETLDLSYCIAFPINVKSLNPLYNFFAVNHTLKNLVLKGGKGVWLTEALGKALAGLEYNRGLKAIDISGNYIGDAGLMILGQTLRKNRTLSSVCCDENKAGPEGYKAIRGCFYGNKKIVEFIYPKQDLNDFIEHASSMIRNAEQQEQNARAKIKYASRNYDWHGKEIALNELRAAKRVQNENQKGIERFRGVLSEILMEVQNNQKIQSERNTPSQKAEAKKAELVQKATIFYFKTRYKFSRDNVRKLKEKKSEISGADKFTGKYFNYAFQVYKNLNLPYDEILLWCLFIICESHPAVRSVLNRRLIGDIANFLSTTDMYSEVRACGETILKMREANNLPAYMLPQPPISFKNAEERFQFEREQALRAPKLFGLSLVHLILEHRYMISLQTERLPPAIRHVYQNPRTYRDDTYYFFTTSDDTWCDDYDYWHWHKTNYGGDDVAYGFNSNYSDHGRDSGHSRSHDNSDKKDYSAHYLKDDKDDKNADDGFDDHPHDDFGNMDNKHHQNPDGYDINKEDHGFEDQGADNVDGDIVAMYGSAGPRNLDGEGKDPPSNDAVVCDDQVTVPVHTKVDPLHEVCKLKSDLNMYNNIFEVCDREGESVEALKQKVYDSVFLSLGSVPTYQTMIWKESLICRSLETVTIVTQCTLDRFDALRRHISLTKLPMSVAVYVKTCEQHLWRHAIEEVCQLAAQCDCILDLAVLFENVPGELYPINSLRNLAMSISKTELILNLDVDFLLSSGLSYYVERNYANLLQLSLQKVAFVVPAFELRDQQISLEHVITNDKKLLEELVACNCISAFHMKHFPKGHGSTDYEKWFTKKSPYFVDFEEGYEPYTITAKKLTPLFDNRFRGYGLNKLQHCYKMAFEGFSFQVIPDHFVIAPEHDKSESWKRVFGKEGDLYNQERLRCLYKLFKTELYKSETSSQFPFKLTTSAE